MKISKISIILIFLLSLSVSFAQDKLDDKMELLIKQPVGNEFWLCFMMNFRDDTASPKNALILELFITGDKDANVEIECAAIGYKEKLFVPGGTVRSLVLTDKVMVRSFEVIERGLAVKVTSDFPISVYGLNRRYQTTDTYLGLPVNVLGDEYRVMTYHVAEDLSPLYAIVATEDNTMVTITPSALTQNGKKRGEPFVVTLNQGDVYQVRSETNRMHLRELRINEREIDQTGTHIKSNKKIAVFSGHECTYVPVGPPRIKACNHIVEQLPPIPSWGKHFYVGRLKGRSSYTYRVLAHQDGTKIFENTKYLLTLNAGNFLERNSKEDLQITADKPVLVSQYSQGYENGDAIGDPMMLLISPTQQFLTQYRFATPVNGSWNHFVNVVVPTRAINTIELNGKKIDPKQFSPLGISRYSIGFIQVPFGTHFIKAREPFGMYSYGFGFGDVDAYDAYGNMGGQSFLEYVPVIDNTPPTAEIRNIDQKQVLILRDDRADDTGLSRFSIADSMGIKINHPSLTEGTLQLSVDITPITKDQPGQIHFFVSDVANNQAEYTLCYTINQNTGKFEFIISHGHNKSCIPDPGFIVGAFGKYSVVSHSADFSSSGNLSVPGKFTTASGTGGIGGLYIGRRFLYNLYLSARLSLDNYGGELAAPDSIISNRRDPQTGQLLPFQETHYLELNSKYITLSFAGEYYLNGFLYITAGINVSILASNDIELRRRITIPDNFVYSNGDKEQVVSSANSLNSLNSLRFGGFGGLGASVPVFNKISAFTEASYNLYPFDIINDASWTVNNINFLIGIKYQL